jgi:hypothetical protein
MDSDGNMPADLAERSGYDTCALLLKAKLQKSVRPGETLNQTVRSMSRMGPRLELITAVLLV